MTEDEMADEYVEKYGFKSDHKNLTPQEANEAIRLAYLAGLEDSPRPMA